MYYVKNDNEIDELLQFFVETFKEYNDIGEGVSLGLKPLVLSQFNENPEYIMYIKDNDEIIAGIFSFYEKNDNTIIIDKLAVKKEYRLKGLGSKLLDSTEKIALKNNVSKLEVHSNDFNYDFYLKNNFKPILYVIVFDDISEEDFKNSNKYNFKTYNYISYKRVFDNKPKVSSKIYYFVDAPKKEYINYYNNLYKDSFSDYIFIKELKK
jgi:GNAT superfamily N-acetyltransferase